MREIKFRGKRLDDGELICGDIIHNNEQVFISTFEHEPYEYESAEVDKKTVGQFTGLKDKNGFEIYEGDIVECVSQLFSNWGKTPTGKYTKSLYEIIWNKDGWATKEIYNDRRSKEHKDKIYINNSIFSLTEKFYEVIGNVYEDKNLLEELEYESRGEVINRPLKFRAWDNVKDRMHYCGEESDVCFEITSVGILGTDISGDYANFEELHHLKYMQYTGLKDKNGTEIYEGDIAECVFDGNLNIYVVVYDLSELGFKGTNGKENYGKNFEYLQCCEEIIVIGNIYEHKQLMEVNMNE